MAKAYPYKPDGSVDTLELDVTTYTETDGETLPSGGYYITRHMRVPMKIGSDDKHVAIFPKTIASQVLETTGRVFVSPSQQKLLAKLSIVDGEGIDDTKHIKITDGGIEYRVPSTFEIGIIQTQVTTLSDDIDTLNNSSSDYEARIGTLEDFFEIDDPDGTINKWHEIEAFLNGITDSGTLNQLIISTISNLKSSYNEWTDTNSFKNELWINRASEPGESAILTFFAKSDGGTQPEHTVNLTLDPNVLSTTSQTLNILFPKKSGTLATQSEIPYIGFVAPSAPKAGDMWFSA